MAGVLTEDTLPLENLEPHKCLGWFWMTWEELFLLNKEHPERLFDPLRNLLNQLKDEEPILFP
jgi:hypothetical protein